MAEPRDLGESYERCIKEIAAPPSKAGLAALVRLLIAKGVFTEAEWLEARRKEANELLAVERDRVERRPRPRDLTNKDHQDIVASRPAQEEQ